MILRNIFLSWRNIWKNGIYSFINITGLAIGIAVVALILFWVVDELSFDKYHTNLDQIYTVYEHQEYSEGQELFTYCTPFPLSQKLVKDYPEVKNATTFTQIGNQLIRFEDKEHTEVSVFCVDKEFLNIFTYTIIEGNKDALQSPDNIIITEEIAHLFFGTETALGKILKIQDKFPVTVGAVIASETRNSSFDFKILTSEEFMSTALGVDLTRWENNWPRTSILIDQGRDISDLNDKISNICKDNGQENTTLALFPFKDEHLYSYSGKNNRIQYIYLFLGIALIILLIASINFINLSTARAEQRRPEVGVRKVMGANRINILKQFLLEKGMMIFLSLVLSGILVILLLPAFSSISDKTITFELLQNKYMILMLLAVVLIVLVLSVVYPSMYLSSFNPALAIKKVNAGKLGGFGLKNLLVVVQFVLSVILISCTIAISEQLRYINNYNLGYESANLIYLQLNGEAKSKHDALKQELNKITGVVNITKSDKLPLWGGNSSWGYDWEGKDPENRVLICRMLVDNNYLETMGIKLVEGHSFPDIYEKVINLEDLTSPEIILNQEAIRRMGIKNPEGKYFGMGDIKGSIAGVVENFHFESLRNGIEPMLLLPLVNDPNYMIIRVHPAKFSSTIENIKKSWSQLLPQSVCEVGFFNDRLERMYNSEVRISSLFKYFSFIAIFISCIGLFGLSLFIIERRKKEIGIRRVNGAKISEIITLLNKDFVLWVVIAIVIATPLAWYTMNKWLQNFAYQTNLSWWIFTLAGMLAVGIALLTVSWQSWRAATRNPVDALRYE